MAFIRKLNLSGNYGKTASTYVGGLDDIWADDTNNSVLRRGDGTTPGGVIIGGAGGVSDYNSLTNKPTIPADVADLTDSTNLLTALQAAITTNEIAIIVETARAIEADDLHAINLAATDTVHAVERASADADRALIRTEFATADATAYSLHAVELASNTLTLQNNIDTNTAAITAETTRATAAEVANATAIANLSAGPAEQDFAIHTTNFNAVSSARYAIDTSSAVVTATLPASPSTGDAIMFADAGGNYAINNLTIGRNNNTIMGVSQDMTLSTNNQSVGLFYNGTTWRIY